MKEEVITVDANLNEGKIIPVKIEGELLAKLGLYQMLLQEEINKEGADYEVSLSETIEYIVTEKLDSIMEVVD
jgi:hypothetical protein